MTSLPETINMPSPDSRLRELFNVNQLDDLISLPTFRQAVNLAREFFNVNPGVKTWHSICVRFDGSIWLVSFGRNGGWKRLWIFYSVARPVNIPPSPKGCWKKALKA